MSYERLLPFDEPFKIIVSSLLLSDYLRAIDLERFSKDQEFDFFVTHNIIRIPEINANRGIGCETRPRNGEIIKLITVKELITLRNVLSFIEEQPISIYIKKRI